MHITAIARGCSAPTRSWRARGDRHGAATAAPEGQDALVVCFFGDGASNQGILHEA